MRQYNFLYLENLTKPLYFRLSKTTQKSVNTPALILSENNEYKFIYIYIHKDTVLTAVVH